MKGGLYDLHFNFCSSNNVGHRLINEVLGVVAGSAKAIICNYTSEVLTIAVGHRKVLLCQASGFFFILSVFFLAWLGLG